jgi:hypothetical protein
MGETMRENNNNSIHPNKSNTHTSEYNKVYYSSMATIKNLGKSK